MKKRLAILSVWIVAILSLSRVIHAVRELIPGFSWGTLLEGLLWLMLLGASLFLLGLRTYAVEKSRRRVVKQIGIYERILEPKDPPSD